MSDLGLVLFHIGAGTSGSHGFREPNTGKTGTDMPIVFIVHDPQITLAGSTASFNIPNDLS
jgi:hypothetical protein